MDISSSFMDIFLSQQSANWQKASDTLPLANLPTCFILISTTDPDW